MQATGIIAEYNPFHNGHQYHIRQAKRLTQQPVIVAMSGSFMQRGEPAILSKWQRAALAVSCGADLVLELPCAFTLRSAEFFAQGGVSLLA
ncbi:nucleotidyltransferase family protein, partial [Phascolarctobacterium succinatutens]